MSLANDQITINKKEGEVRVSCRACSHERKKSKEKCLAINAESGAYMCHHCGDSGIILSHRTIISNDEKYDRPQPSNATALSDKLYEWFKDRGISAGTIIRNKITQSEEYMPQVSKNRIAVNFNYYREGELINIKYRDAEKNFKQTKNAEKIFYGLDDIKDCTEVYIVEGEMDKLSLEEAGITNCVSVPDGAPNPGTKNYDNKFSYLDNCWSYFDTVEKIHICSDNDTNGRVLLEEISRRLGRERCNIVNFPEGIKDANQMLVELGPIKLEECLKNSVPYPVEGIFTVDSEKGYMLDVFHNGKKKGLTTGYRILDNHYKLRTSELDVWTGVPGSGKTMMAMQIMLNASVLYGWKWGVFSPENYPVGDLFDVLAEMYIGNTSDMDKDKRMTEYEYETAINFLNEHFYAIYPEDDFSLDNVLSKFKHLVMRYGIKGCLLDPFNQLDHEFKGKDETTYIGECLTKIRRFEQVNDLKFIIIAHPRKMDKDDTGLHYKMPTAYDISGSQNWFNKADNVVCIHRNNPQDTFDTSVRVNIQKVKFQKLVGIPGEQLLKFDRRSNRYLDLGNSCPLDKISYTYSVLMAPNGSSNYYTK
jgi:twinkle protein